MAVFGPNAGGVQYDITRTGGNAITGFLDQVVISGGTNGTNTLTNVPEGNIITATGGSAANLVSLGSTYVVAPGVTSSNINILAAVGPQTIYVGGTTTINSALALLSGTQINVTGGSASLADGILANALSSSTVNLTDGGSFSNGNNLANVLTGTTINYGSGGGTFTVNGGNTLIDLSSTSINGFDQNNGLNHLEFQNTSAPAAAYTVTGPAGGPQTVEIRDAGGNVIATVKLNDSSLTAGNYTVGQNGPLTIGSSGTTLTVTDQAIVCFLAGTMIRTAVGEVAIENIQVGDEVFVSIDGKDELRPVIWIGSGHVLSNPVYPMDMGGYPVRILKDAIAEGVPYQDL
ncbi:Hint domain-containing protein, partial [Labrys sp. (in: a-proteobacteria)]|uniref:Hint domain-containing protein n=1 Tax=Labrys sp. (in: a-proteobacteria) TaxID=1917972 RepID=UPI0039E35D52